jgi:repressor LexA
MADISHLPDSALRSGDSRRRDYVPRTSFQRWLKPLLEARDWTYADLYRQLVALTGTEVTENYLYRIVRGDPAQFPNARRPGYELAFAIGRVFGDVRSAVSAAGYPVADYLPSHAPSNGERNGGSNGAHRHDAVPEDTIRVPVIGRIAPGEPLLSAANVDEFVTVPRSWAPRGEETRCFALTVRGDSMMGADIRDGDVLVVRMIDAAEDGRVVVARRGDQVAVKRLRYRLNLDNLRPQGWLYSDPEDYMLPLPIGPDAAVIGIPVGYLRQRPASWG